MATLSQSQLARLWIQAGGDPSQAGTASAVALAESSGNTSATNHNTDGSTDLGGWQINNKAHPQYNQQQLLSNPLYNAKAAVAISSNGKDWGPWVTYKTGAYKKFLSGFRGPARSGAVPGQINSGDTAAAAKLESEGITSQSGVLDTLGLGALSSTLDIVGNPIRIGKIIIGGVLLIIALDRLSGIKAIPTPIPV
jgi:hypothetical protein